MSTLLQQRKQARPRTGPRRSLLNLFQPRQRLFCTYVHLQQILLRAQWVRMKRTRQLGLSHRGKGEAGPLTSVLFSQLIPHTSLVITCQWQLPLFYLLVSRLPLICGIRFSQHEGLCSGQTQRCVFHLLPFEPIYESFCVWITRFWLVAGIILTVWLSSCYLNIK